MKSVILNKENETLVSNADEYKYYGIEHFPSQSKGFVSADNRKPNNFKQFWGTYLTKGNFNQDLGSHNSLQGLLTAALEHKGNGITYKVYEFDSFRELMIWVLVSEKH